MADVYEQLREVVAGGAGEPPSVEQLRTRRGRRLPRRAVVAALLLVLVSALVVAVAVQAPSRGPQRSVTPPTTAETPPMTPVGFVSAPIHSDGHELTLWSWQGHTLRTLHAGPNLSCCWYETLVSPNSRLILLPGAKRSEVVTPTGRVVGHGNLFGAIWADDSRHFCELTAAAGGPPNGLARLAIIGLDGRQDLVPGTVPGSNTDHTGSGLAYCDLATHTALDVSITMGAITALTAINTVTGVTHTLSWAQHMDFELSGDQKYAALIDGRIVATENGRTVATVPGQPVAISWLGHVVVYRDRETNEMIAYDWASHRRVWSDHQTGSGCHCNSATVTTRSRPGTDQMVMTVSPPLVHDRAALVLIGPGQQPKVLDRSVVASVTG